MVPTFYVPQGPEAPFLVFGDLGPNGTWKVGTIWPIDLVFISTFNHQSMRIGCVGKLGYLSGFLRHYLLICFWMKPIQTWNWILTASHTWISEDRFGQCTEHFYRELHSIKKSTLFLGPTRRGAFLNLYTVFKFLGFLGFSTSGKFGKRFTWFNHEYWWVLYINK